MKKKCIVLVGQSKVGKTSILEQFLSLNKIEHQKSDNCTKYRFLSKTFKLFETSNIAPFSTLSFESYNDILGIILVYDIENKQSFKVIKNWVKQNFFSFNKKYKVILVGNKSDLKQKVSTSEVSELAQKFFLYSMNCSAKTGQGINIIFEFMSTCYGNNINFTNLILPITIKNLLSTIETKDEDVLNVQLRKVKLLLDQMYPIVTDIDFQPYYSILFHAIKGLKNEKYKNRIYLYFYLRLCYVFPGTKSNLIININSIQNIIHLIHMLPNKFDKIHFYSLCVNNPSIIMEIDIKDLFNIYEILLTEFIIQTVMTNISFSKQIISYLLKISNAILGLYTKYKQSNKKNIEGLFDFYYMTHIIESITDIVIYIVVHGMINNYTEISKLFIIIQIMFPLSFQIRRENINSDKALSFKIMCIFCLIASNVQNNAFLQYTIQFIRSNQDISIPMMFEIMNTMIFPELNKSPLITTFSKPIYEQYILNIFKKKTNIPFLEQRFLRNYKKEMNEIILLGSKQINVYQGCFNLFINFYQDKDCLISINNDVYPPISFLKVIFIAFKNEYNTKSSIYNCNTEILIFLQAYLSKKKKIINNEELDIITESLLVLNKNLLFKNSDYLYKCFSFEFSIFQILFENFIDTMKNKRIANTLKEFMLFLWKNHYNEIYPFLNTFFSDFCITALNNKCIEMIEPSIVFSFNLLDKKNNKIEKEIKLLLNLSRDNKYNQNVLQALIIHYKMMLNILTIISEKINDCFIKLIIQVVCNSKEYYPNIINILFEIDKMINIPNNKEELEINLKKRQKYGRN